MPSRYAFVQFADKGNEVQGSNIQGQQLVNGTTGI